jgi:hypothetical protein
VQAEIRSKVLERLATRNDASGPPVRLWRGTVENPRVTSEERSDDE